MTEPKAVKIDNTHYILKEDFSYSWNVCGENASDPKGHFDIETIIKIKAGFRWDGASIPKMFWSWGFKPDGKYRAAALVHDYIYIHKGKLPKGSIISNYQKVKNQKQSGSFSRKDADRLFGKMMKENEVASWRRKIMKRMVMWFGWLYWKDGPDLMTRAVFNLISFAVLVTILLKLLGIWWV